MTGIPLARAVVAISAFLAAGLVGLKPRLRGTDVLMVIVLAMAECVAAVGQ